MTDTTTRKTATPPRRTLHLPRLGWWWLTTPLVAGAAADTWPTATALLIILTVAGLIVWAIRPAWARPFLDHLPTITTRPRSALPAHGRRTIAAFQAMNPTRFEHAITELTNQHPDITTATHTGRTADRGLDVLATHDNGARILIQCKRYTGNIGSDTIREVAGSVLANGCQHGTIVTTAGFTPEAYATNQMLGRNALTLIDGHALEQWANGRHLPWR